MSLLMKALKKAEQNQKESSSAGQHPGAETGQQAERGDGRRHQPAPLPFLAPQPQRKWLVPATAALATVVATAWGIYIYLETSAPIPLTLPPQPSPARPADHMPAPPVSHRAGPRSNPPSTSLPEERPQAAPAPPGRDRGTPQRAHPVQPPASATPAARASVIKVDPGDAQAAVDPTLSRAYQALRQGRHEAARALYQRLLESDPDSVDALLGLAVIAARRNEAEQSAEYYLRVLRLDPKNPVAQAGLIGLTGGSDPLASESRLQRLLARQPAAFLFFALGNLYAGQARWPAAEGAYFEAYQKDPGDPDYAFNLAVSLDHLTQRKAALSYYRRAQQLAQAKGGHGFDPALLAARIARLSAEGDGK